MDEWITSSILMESFVQLQVIKLELGISVPIKVFKLSFLKKNLPYKRLYCQTKVICFFNCSKFYAISMKKKPCLFLYCFIILVKKKKIQYLLNVSCVPRSCQVHFLTLHNEPWSNGDCFCTKNKWISEGVKQFAVNSWQEIGSLT